MSAVIQTSFDLKNTSIVKGWEKGQGFFVSVREKFNGEWTETTRRTYHNQEAADKGFNYYVKKIKKELGEPETTTQI